MLDVSLTIDDLPSLLQYISPDVDRQTWIKVGNAIKTEFGENGFSYWDSWSAGGDDYKAKEAMTTWRSLKAGKNSFGVLVNMAKERGWQYPKKTLTPAEKKRIKEEQEARRLEREAQIQADDAKLKRMQSIVAPACQKVWDNFGIKFGHSEYLKNKKVTALDIRFFHQSVVLWIDDIEEKAGVISGAKVSEFFKKLPKPRPDNIYFLFFKKGTIAVPLYDDQFKLWSLQAINGTGVKLFPKYGRKMGLFHIIGYLKDAKAVAAAEGYATAASIHMATEWPVFVCFDNGNMVNVAPVIKEKAPTAKILFCADKDDNGSGEKFATQAALLIGADVVMPDFGGEV